MIISFKDLEHVIPMYLNTIVCDDSYDDYELRPILPWYKQDHRNDLYVSEINLCYVDGDTVLLISYESESK